MKDHPIIFSAPMVRALLEGRKTQTRRLAWKPLVIAIATEGHPTEEVRDASLWQRVQPGDRLYVREAWKPHSLYDHMAPRDMPQAKVFYLADDAYSPSGSRGRPGIHMPRWASRLTLTVTAAKVERLQAITEDDARAEGIYWSRRWEGWTSGAGADETVDFHTSRPDRAFASLWERLHGDGAWAANPEVVALSFTVARENIDQREAADD